MRAARCTRHGRPGEVVAVEEVADPVAGPGQAVVAVAAASVNYPDALIVANRYQVSLPAPFTPGSEFAGTVLSVGPGVEGIAAGDRVRGGGMAGAFAEQVVVAAAGLAVLPEGVDLKAAATYGVTYETAWHALFSVAGLQEGEWVAVLGAGGGVGSAAVQLAALHGASVVALAAGERKLAVAREMGAREVIDYTTEDVKVRLKEITGGGADVVIDPVGGPYSEPALRAMRWGGRFVVLGFAAGEIPRIPLNLILLKGITVSGFEFLGFGRHRAADLAAGSAQLRRLLAEGRIAPHIGATVGLDGVAGALDAVLDRQAVGKILVLPGS